jgi:hypothetical protein
VYLCGTLPLLPLGSLGAGGLALYAGTVYLTLRNRQRSVWYQLVSVPGLTASALLGFLAASGELVPTAFWVWMLFTAHLSVSVLVVRAQLEGSVAALKKRAPFQRPKASRCHAALAEGVLWLILGLVALQGQPQVALAFLPPSVFHCWLLWRLGSERRAVSMHRVGFAALIASVSFSVILILLFA